MPCDSLQISRNLISNSYSVPGFPTNQETVRSKVSAVASFAEAHWRGLGRLHLVTKCKGGRRVFARQCLPSSLPHRRAAGGGTPWPQWLPWGPHAPPCCTPIGLGHPRPQPPFPAPGLFRLPWINSPGRLARSLGRGSPRTIAFFATTPTDQGGEVEDSLCAVQSSALCHCTVGVQEWQKVTLET